MGSRALSIADAIRRAQGGRCCGIDSRVRADNGIVCRRIYVGLNEADGVSTAASVTDDAATPDLTRPQTWSRRLTPLAAPPQVSVALALRTLCSTTPERGFLADRRPAYAHGCVRK